MSDTKMFLDPGTRLGKYEIVRLMGTGGMGAIYEARHTGLRKSVAIKTLHPDVAKHPMALQRFLREAEAAARIRHPHIVDVTDVGEDGGTPYMVMEFLSGVDLKNHLTEKGALPIGDAVDLMLPVISAVSAGHEAGVIHRDLKPQNIFLVRSRRGDLHPKVLDFGISKMRDGSPGGGLSLTGPAVVGTLGYMSPEQARGSKYVDERTDQYGLGLVLYECLTGAPALEAESLIQLLSQISEGRLRPPRVVRGDLPEALERIVLRCLSVDPAHRFANLTDMGEALLPFAGRGGRAVWKTTFSRLGATTGEHEPVAMPEPTMLLPENGTPGPRPGSGGGIGNLAGETLPAAQAVLAPAAAGATRVLGSGGESKPDNSKESKDKKSTLGHSAGEIADKQTGSRARRVPWLWLGGAVVGVAVGGLILMRGKPPVARSTAAAVAPAATVPDPAPPPPRSVYRVSVQATPPEAEFLLDGTPAGRGSLSRELDVDGRTHTLEVRAPGHTPMSLSFTDAPPPPQVALERVSEPREDKRDRRKPEKDRAARRKPVESKATAAAPRETPPATSTPAPSPKPSTKLGVNRAPIIAD